MSLQKHGILNTISFIYFCKNNMSLSLIDKLHQQAKNATATDVSKMCNSVLEVFYMPDKSADSMSLLRQLYFILQATDKETCIPEKLIVNMLTTVATGEKTKVKECALCQRLMQELLPLDGAEEQITKFEEKTPSGFHLQMFQGKNVACINALFLNAVRWLQVQDLDQDTHRKVFSFLIGVSMLHTHVLTPDKLYKVNERLSSSLMETGLFQAQNPYTSNPFRKDKNNLVTEVDGTSSTNFFTVLNIGQYYTDDQMINIYSFSMLYQWIQSAYTALANHSQYANEYEFTIEADDPEAPPLVSKPRPILSRSSTPTKLSMTRSSSNNELLQRSPSAGSPKSSFTSSLPRHSAASPLKRVPSGGQLRATTPSNMSRSTTPTKTSREGTPTEHSRASTPVDEPKLTLLMNNKRNVAQKVFDTLVGRTLDYCFRILDQCERKTKVLSDVELQNACLLETVKLLDLICKIDNSQIPKAYRELKRLSSHSDPSNVALTLGILQFLLNHCDAVAYDPREELKTMFHTVLSRHYNSLSISFDIVMFILDNLEELCLDYNIMSTYFPNMLKLLAWNPRTFVSEFTEIVPAMMSMTSSLEVFHALIDLPCMTGALEVGEKMKNVDLSAVIMSSVDQEPTNAMEAFRNAMFRPMFNFFTRSEGGHGDTINRLDSFHKALQNLTEQPRVMVCCQVVPVLLRIWFGVILEEGSLEFTVELVPVLLERTGLLYGIAEYQNDIKRIISENVILLLKKYPQVVLKQKREITDFLSNTKNITGRENFYCQLVWGVGEYISARYDEECSADTVAQVYEVLEVVTYEVIGVTSTTHPDKAPYTVKVVSTLMSALSKLACRCQDLIPRAILSLTKVAKQHQKSLLETDQKDILFNRAQELINLLKMPNFASVILNPPANLTTSRIHRDRTSMATVLRATYRVVAPTL